MPRQSAIWGLQKRGKSDTFPFVSGWPGGPAGRVARSCRQKSLKTTTNPITIWPFCCVFPARRTRPKTTPKIGDFKWYLSPKSEPLNLSHNVLLRIEWASSRVPNFISIPLRGPAPTLLNFQHRRCWIYPKKINNSIYIKFSRSDRDVLLNSQKTSNSRGVIIITTSSSIKSWVL